MGYSTMDQVKFVDVVQAFKKLQGCKIIYLRLIRPIFKTHVHKCMSYREAIEGQLIKIFFCVNS